jgi:branched-chain amino acid transport system substrate-binding protein
MRHHHLAALVIGVLLAVTACTNSTEGSGASSGGGTPSTTASAADLTRNIPSTQPGVSDTEIRVAALGAYTNAVGADFSQAPKGAQAYFDMINAQGGIYGRKLVISEEIDDQMLRNKDQINKIISDNNVFAVLPVTAVLFTGAADLADSGIPTFGWVNNEDWANAPNFYGEKGSVHCISCPQPHLAYAAREAGAKKIGIIAYGVDQSKVCADGIKATFSTFPVAQVAFTDDSLPLGSTDYSVQVQRMKDENVDFVITCTDGNSNATLAKELKKQASPTRMFLQNGYESSLLDKFGPEFEGAYLFSSVAALESEPAASGVADYKEWIAKVDGADVGEQSMIGWASAHLLYQGLVLAGPEFTQKSVVSAMNTITDWDADGVLPTVDWTKAHTELVSPRCLSVLKVENGRYVPLYGEPGKPFICLEREGTLPDKAPVLGA